MIGSIAVTDKQKALAELTSMSEHLEALSARVVELNHYPAKAHVDAAWRSIQFARQVVEQKP